MNHTTPARPEIPELRDYSPNLQHAARRLAMDIALHRNTALFVPIGQRMPQAATVLLLTGYAESKRTRPGTHITLTAAGAQLLDAESQRFALAAVAVRESLQASK